MKSRMMPILSLVVLLVAVATAVASAAQFDLGGKTVTIISNADVFASENMQIRRAEVEAQFNCKLVGLPVAMAEAPEVITARVMAGDSTYDVYVMNSRGYFPLVANNILLPIGELLGEEYYENLPPLARANIESLRYHGRLYGFGVKSSFASQCAIAWNKDMFEREGLPDLYEVYESGEWTYDTMIELAKTLTRDLDGDGVIDQWGIGGLRNYETLVRFAYSNGAEVVREDESGRWVFSYDQPEAIEALDMYRDLLQVHNVVPADDPWQANAFIEGQNGMQFIQLWQLGEVATNMTEEYGVVPYPRGPRADFDVFPVIGADTYVVAANAAEPEALVAITDAVWPAEEFEASIQKNMIAWTRDRDSFEVLQTAFNNWGGEVFHFAGVLGPLWTDVPLARAFTKILNGEQSSAAAMAEVKDTIQLTIDELFGQ